MNGDLEGKYVLGFVVGLCGNPVLKLGESKGVKVYDIPGLEVVGDNEGLFVICAKVDGHIRINFRLRICFGSLKPLYLLNSNGSTNDK